MTRLTRSTRLAAATALSLSLAAAPAARAQNNAPPPPAPAPAAAAPAPAATAPAAAAPAPGPAIAPAADADVAPPLAPAPGAPAPGQAAETAAPAADPPTRAGRIARLSGTVSFHGPGEDHWEAATLNFPVTDGDALWTEPNASAAMDVSASRLTLAGGTELDVDKLDATTLTLTAPQGEVYLRLSNLAPNETFTLVTPRGTVSIAQAGRYEVAAGDQSAPTMVTVLEGQARITADNLNLTVQPGQTASVTGDHNFQGSVGAQQSDAFLALVEQQAAPPAVQTSQAAPPPAVAAMPGAEDLSQAGTWQQSADYGSVWYPSVAAGWVPYRDGRWAFVAPWGWTWVDNASWGFAPFHYGRWLQYGGRWGWSPGYAAAGWAAPAGLYASPVYAPALVSFVGFGGGVGVGVGFGVGVGVGFGFGGFGARVGWLPLGWGEPFHPWYGGSAGYFGRVNGAYVRNVNITNIRNTNVTINNYANRNAATVVPTSTLTGSRPVAAAAQPLSAQQIASLHPAAVVPKPTAGTAGVTPTVAHQLSLPAAPAGTAAKAAPGPAITPTAAGHAATPALATPGGTHATTPATPHAAGAPGPAITPHTPGTAPTPALRPTTPAGTTHTTTPTPGTTHTTTPTTGTTHTTTPTTGTTHTPTPTTGTTHTPTPTTSTTHTPTPTTGTTHAPTPQVIHPPTHTTPTPQTHTTPTPQHTAPTHAPTPAHTPTPQTHAAPAQHAPAPHQTSKCPANQKC